VTKLGGPPYTHSSPKKNKGREGGQEKSRGGTDKMETKGFHKSSPLMQRSEKGKRRQTRNFSCRQKKKMEESDGSFGKKGLNVKSSKVAEEGTLGMS